MFLKVPNYRKNIVYKYFVREDGFCAFKGFSGLDLRLGVKEIFMHKKHSLHARNTYKNNCFYAVKIETIETVHSGA
jgi:hypothetical protein